MKAAIYVRVSTVDQAEEGYSIDEQLDKLRKYCDIKDWAVYDTYIDPGYSGSSIKRPAIERLITDAKKKRFDTVVVYKLDRLSRSQKDTLYLIEDVFAKHDVAFVSLNENFDTTTAFGKAMVGIISAFGQLEREQITERMQMGKVGRAKSGKPMSWVKNPFGYKYIDGEYVIQELEASLIKRIFTDYMSGVSITKLRDILNEEGYIGKDIKWSYRTIRQALDNPVYAGDIKFKGEVYRGNHKPIVSRELFDAVQAELEVRQKQAYEQSNNHRPFQAKYMLSGSIRCGQCGAPLSIQIGRLKDGTNSYRYHCKNRKKARSGPTIYNDGKPCDSGSFKMSDIEEYVLDQIERLQNNPKLREKLYKKHKEASHVDTYKKRIAFLTKKLEKLSTLYMNDMLSISDVQTKGKPFKEEIKQLENKLKEEKVAKKTNKALDWFEEGNRSVKEESYKRQKEIVNTLIYKVDVTREEIVINWKL